MQRAAHSESMCRVAAMRRNDRSSDTRTCAGDDAGYERINVEEVNQAVAIEIGGEEVAVGEANLVCAGVKEREEK